MQKEFTKADLKDGMVVEYENGKRRLVIADMLIGKDGFSTLNSYSEELKSNSFDENTIVKTYKIRTPIAFDHVLDDANLELIWQRTETKHMTADEMRQKLEDLIGEKIEIEPSRNEMISVLTKYCSGNDRCSLCYIRKECEKNEKYDFWDYSTESLKQCYEKVIANGK